MVVVVALPSIHDFHNYPHDHNVFYPSMDRILDNPPEDDCDDDDDDDIDCPHICNWEK